MTSRETYLTLSNKGSSGCDDQLKDNINLSNIIDREKAEREVKVVQLEGEEEHNKVIQIEPNETTDDEAVKHRRMWFASPKFVLMCSMLEISLLTYTLVYFNVIEGEFFRLGPPIQLFQYRITEKSQYYAILCMFFVHQLMYTWLNEVCGPWMLNEVQNPKNTRLSFSKGQTLVLINFYYIYFSLNSVMLVNVSLSQLSFLVVMLSADVVATTTLNSYYMWNKKYIAPGSCLGCNEKCQEEGRSRKSVDIETPIA